MGYDIPLETREEQVERRLNTLEENLFALQQLVMNANLMFLDTTEGLTNVLGNIAESAHEHED